MGAAVVSGGLTGPAAPSTLPVLSVTLTAQPAVSAEPGGSLFSFPIELHASVVDSGTGGSYTYTYLLSCGAADAALTHASPTDAQARCTYFSRSRFIAKVSVAREGAAPVGATA